MNRWFYGGLIVDNLAGSATNKALIKALQMELNSQFNAGLKVDGLWGAKTKNACITVREGANGNLTRLIKAALICKGYDVKGFDGKFGDGLDKAVKKFQSAKALKVDGLVGQGTFEALFK
ncbi:peptidoglycan-binding domain-containing protein [Carnobacterium viridans]|uniref:peptidoglycan-binding domain-containing protein n=1 Tax=Carnobacterium viridans TaxID=174587 RepID=UPI00159F9D07|nr:peptidoglycan-binding domain-containing protein [Carnobacterium viridans]